MPVSSTFTLGSLSLLRKECLLPFSLPASTLEVGPGLAPLLQGICGPRSHADAEGSGDEAFTSRLGMFYYRGSQAQGTDIICSGSLDSVEPGQPAEPTQRGLDSTGKPRQGRFPCTIFLHGQLQLQITSVFVGTSWGL